MPEQEQAASLQSSDSQANSQQKYDLPVSRDNDQLDVTKDHEERGHTLG